MKRKKIDELMKKIDNTKKPKHWRKFINKNTTGHNIILKFGNRAFCTHCQKYFDKNVFVHPYKKEKCKWCGNEYYVRNNNIKNFTFLKDIAFYTKVDDKVVLRIFEIESKYDYKTKTFKHNLQEFARFVPNMGIIINNAVSFYMWNQKIWHNTKIKKWHIYTGNRILYEMPIYPYNKRELFKNTPLQYAPIKEFKEEYGYYDKFQILQVASYQSFELLWKMGLHRLSLHSKFFNKKGNFEKRFGVPKSFLKFMVENNIDFEDYKILKLIQKPNMKLIQQYRRYDYNYLSFMKKQGLIDDLDILQKFYRDSSILRDISKYVPIKKFIKYEKGVKNIYIYADYLKMAEILGYSIKSKKRLFPYQLKAWHDKLSKKIEIAEDMKTQFAIYMRYLELSKYTYEDNKYIIFPATSVDDIKEEGINQGNCVATNYLRPYFEKETEIFFARKLEDVTKSFITLEYKNGRVVQKELPHHDRNFTDEQLAFIDKWLGHRSFTDQKEKIKNKTKIKIKKYDITQMAA